MGVVVIFCHPVRVGLSPTCKLYYSTYDWQKSCIMLLLHTITGIHMSFREVVSIALLATTITQSGFCVPHSSVPTMLTPQINPRIGHAPKHIDINPFAYLCWVKTFSHYRLRHVHTRVVGLLGPHPDASRPEDRIFQKQN